MQLSPVGLAALLTYLIDSCRILFTVNLRLGYGKGFVTVLFNPLAFRRRKFGTRSKRHTVNYHSMSYSSNRLDLFIRQLGLTF